MHEGTNRHRHRDEDNFTFPFQFSTMPRRIMENNKCTHTTFSKFPFVLWMKVTTTECTLISYINFLLRHLCLYCSSKEHSTRLNECIKWIFFSKFLSVVIWFRSNEMNATQRARYRSWVPLCFVRMHRKWIN